MTPHENAEALWRITQTVAYRDAQALHQIQLLETALLHFGNETLDRAATALNREGLPHSSRVVNELKI